MPELPEVETICRELANSSIIGSTIRKLSILWKPTLTFPKDHVVGQVILDIFRKGKFIVIRLTDYFLLVHLRMTGKFTFTEENEPLPHERVRMVFNQGPMLVYQDQRKFGRWYLMKSLEEMSVGIEPLSPDFTVKSLEKVLSHKKRAIKPVIIDQTLIAGIGNIYADEALWQAKIHPLRPASSLSHTEVKKLRQAIVDVLEKGIENQGTTLGSHLANYFSVGGRRGSNQYGLKVFRREGEPCPRCGTTILKIKVAQRGTHFCPFCQTLPL